MWGQLNDFLIQHTITAKLLHTLSSNYEKPQSCSFLFEHNGSYCFEHIIFALSRKLVVRSWLLMLDL